MQQTRVAGLTGTPLTLMLKNTVVVLPRPPSQTDWLAGEMLATT